VPDSWFIANKRSPKVLLLALSRLPVGSSAKSTVGVPTNALAMATRCFSPPDNCFGKCFILASRPTLDKALVALFWASSSPWISKGSMTLSRADNFGNKWNDWNTNPTLSPLIVARASSSKEVISCPHRETVPDVGKSSPARIASKVVLPEPDGPTIATVWPLSTLKVISLTMDNTPSGLLTFLVMFFAFMSGVFKMKCRLFSFIVLALFAAANDANAFDANNPRILIVGDSVSAGLGVEYQKTWPKLLEDKIKEEGYNYGVINASISGDTTSGGAERLPELLVEHQPAIVIIELGGNDGLRGFPITTIKNNLTIMIEQAQSRQADVLLAGMQLPPNYGPAYTESFAALFPELATKHNVELIPRIMQDVALDGSLMQNDGIHPNREGQQIIFQLVWQPLQSVLYKTN